MKTQKRCFIIKFPLSLLFQCIDIINIAPKISQTRVQSLVHSLRPTAWLSYFRRVRLCDERLLNHRATMENGKRKSEQRDVLSSHHPSVLLFIRSAENKLLLSSRCCFKKHKKNAADVTSKTVYLRLRVCRDFKRLTESWIAWCIQITWSAITGRRRNNIWSFDVVCVWPWKLWITCRCMNPSLKLN